MTNAAKYSSGASAPDRAHRKPIGQTIFRNVSFILLAGILATLCFGKVETHFDKAVDFTHYKTYEWLAPRVLKKTGVVENDPVFAPAVKAAVNRELVRRGLSEVTSGGQLQVTAMALTTSIPSIDAMIFPGEGVYTGVGGVMTTPNANVATVGRYNKEGTLALSLIDTSTKKAVWGAMATKSYGKETQLEGKVNKAVTDMLKEYPIKPSK
jgi:hypothetical protein